MAKVNAFIGIGSNLGDSVDLVKQAITRLGQLPNSRLTGQSSLFRTAPVDADGDDYINAVVRIETELSATELLKALLGVEQSFGRERLYLNAPRTLDLDILLYGDEKIASASLHIPHPRMQQRAFVIIPLLQIDPLVTIPGKGPAHSFMPAVSSQAIKKIEA